MVYEMIGDSSAFNKFEFGSLVIADGSRTF